MNKASLFNFAAGCWNCDEFYIGKTKRRLHDRKTGHFKALAKSDHSSAIADHVKTTGHDIKVVALLPITSHYVNTE